MGSRLSAISIAILASASIAAGCGGGNGEGGDTAAPSTTPTTRDQAIERCLEEARKLEGDARRTAEAACEAGRTGDTTAVKEAARQQCLNAARNIPDSTARRTAEDRCNQVAK